MRWFDEFDFIGPYIGEVPGETMIERDRVRKMYKTLKGVQQCKYTPSEGGGQLAVICAKSLRMCTVYTVVVYVRINLIK